MQKERLHKLKVESLKNKYMKSSDHNPYSDTKDGVMSDTVKGYLES